MKKDNRRFARMSGTYTCHVCEKLTRETGYGEADLDLCASCYNLGGEENYHFDHHDDGKDFDGNPATEYTSGKPCRWCRWEREGKDSDLEMKKISNPKKW